MDTDGLIALASVILLFGVLPVSSMWAGVLKARYKSQQSNISSAEIENIHRLTIVAERMSERIDVLESILDSEVPDWRNDHE